MCVYFRSTGYSMHFFCSVKFIEGFLVSSEEGDAERCSLREGEARVEGEDVGGVGHHELGVGAGVDPVTAAAHKHPVPNLSRVDEHKL